MQLLALKNQIQIRLECHHYYHLLLKLLGNSIIAGLSTYLKVWQSCFTPLKALNLDLEKAEQKMCSEVNLRVQLKSVVIFCGINKLFTDSPTDIADSIVNIVS